MLSRHAIMSAMPRFRSCVTLGALVLGSPLILHSYGAVIAAAQVGSNTLPTFAPDREALVAQFSGSDVDTIGTGYIVVTPSSFAPPSDVEDPIYHWRFAQTAGIYAVQTQEGKTGLRRVVSIHYEPADRAQAQRSSRLIARLLDLHRQHFGNNAEFHLTESTADVFLAQEASPTDASVGGETRSNFVYIYRADTLARSPIEWVRTVAHEWGHLTLAAARGFREPENDAAGYLGERLYIKWLRAAQAHLDDGHPDDGTNSADLDLYDHRQIEPLIERFAAGGPGSTVLDGVTAESMDYYIGAVLQTDDAYGSKIAGRALDTVTDVHARDFLVALRRIVADSPTITVRPPAWIPLVRGRYSMAVSVGAGSANASKLTVSTSGWKHLDGINRDTGLLTFTRLSDRTR